MVTTAMGNAHSRCTASWPRSPRCAGRLADGRRTAAVTGTWELRPGSDELAHAWIAGYTSRYAVAIWVGNKAERRPIVDRTGRQITGATLPAEIYRAILQARSPVRR